MRDGVILVSLLLFSLLITAKLESLNDSRFDGGFRAVDGDTLASGDDRFRLIGIDAPELQQVCERSSADWACGRQAQILLAQMVHGRSVNCKGNSRDRYGRMLVHCKVGQQDLGAEMVRKGMAVATEYFLFGSEERKARDARSGLWAGHFDLPRDWRRMNEIADADMSSGDIIGTVRNFMGWQ